MCPPVPGGDLLVAVGSQMNRQKSSVRPTRSPLSQLVSTVRSRISHPGTRPTSMAPVSCHITPPCLSRFPVYPYIY
jgi:hypothetical protein